MRRVAPVFAATWLSLLALSACGPGLAPEDLPQLPDIDVSGYLAPVARQLDEARAAVEDEPVNAGANGRLGMLYRTYRSFEAAEVLLRRARMLAPENVDWAYYHGEVLEQLADYEGSLAAMRQVLAAEPDYNPASLRSGVLLTRLGRLDEAADMLETLLASEPDYVGAYLAYATIQERRGDLDGAAQSLRRALGLGGDFGRGHYALSLIYRRQGRDAEADAHMVRFETCKTVAPPANDPRLAKLFKLNRSDRPIVRAAQVAKSRGDDERALELLELAIERNPANPETRAALIAGYASNGEFAQAEAHYREGSARTSAHAAILYSLGRLRFAEGRMSEAAEALTAVTDQTPQNALAWAWLGAALERLGRASAAGDAYARALAADPGNLTARRFYAVWLLINAEPGVAVAELQRMALASFGDGPSMWGYVANAQLKVNDRPAAIDSVDKGIEIAKLRGDSAAAAQLRRQRAELERGLKDQ